MSQNKLTKLPQIGAGALRKLNLEENQIASCDLKKHEALTHLNLNKNKLKNLEGICNLKNLEVLTVNEQIDQIVKPPENPDDPPGDPEDTPCLESVKGLEEVPKLHTLELTASGIKSLEGFPRLPCLTKLNLNGCKVEDVKELDHIAHLTSIKEFSMIESPLAGGDDFKKEVMVKFIDKWPCIEKINDEPLGEDEQGIKDYLKEIRDEIKAREEAAAEAKRQAEEEAAAAAAAAANGDGDGGDA